MKWAGMQRSFGMVAALLPLAKGSPIVCTVMTEKICPLTKPHSSLLFSTQLLSSLHALCWYDNVLKKMH